MLGQLQIKHRTPIKKDNGPLTVLERVRQTWAEPSKSPIFTIDDFLDWYSPSMKHIQRISNSGNPSLRNQGFQKLPLFHLCS